MPFFLKNDATTPCCTRAARPTKWSKPRPQGVCCGTGLVAAPPTASLQPPCVQPPHRPPLRRPPAPWAVRPARHDAPRRSGRLHAPEAPRTGPVSALRRYSSWSPPGRWLNGHNGHFLGQPTRPWVGTPRGVTQVRWAYPTDLMCGLATPVIYRLSIGQLAAQASTPIIDCVALASCQLPSSRARRAVPEPQPQGRSGT